MANDTGVDELERPRSHRENRKKNRGRKVQDSQAQAIAKFIKIQPRKARLVIDEIRGRYAEEALNFLRYVPNRAAAHISKVLSSAMANAANNHGLAVENLRLVEARVDEGPRMKRVQPRAQGRAYRILKRTSHITIVVQEVEPRPRKPKKQTGSRAQAARAARQTTPKPTPSRPVADEPIVTPAIAEEEIIAAPEPEVVDTQEAAAPESVETQIDTQAAEEGEQIANADDTTDEIGAPIAEPEADEA